MAETTVGTVIKVKGNSMTVQLSNNKTVTFEWDKPKLAVGDRAPDDLIQAFDRLKQSAPDNVKSIVL